MGPAIGPGVVRVAEMARRGQDPGAPQTLPARTRCSACHHSADPMALNASERADFFGGADWDVLDGEGRYLGTPTLPPRFRVFRITADAVLGAARDEDGVERVVRLELRR